MATSVIPAPNKKLNKDFSTMTALPQTIATGDLLAVESGGTTYKIDYDDLATTMRAPLIVTPLVVSIPNTQWSGSGSDYYFSVTASNVTVDSILVPNYDSASVEYLKGPIWCVPAAGSFTVHTTAIPSGTVNIMVQFVGIMGTANYQVLADVYSTSQAVAKADIVNNLTSGGTTVPLSAEQGKELGRLIKSIYISANGSYVLSSSGQHHIFIVMGFVGNEGCRMLYVYHFGTASNLVVKNLLDNTDYSGNLTFTWNANTSTITITSTASQGTTLTVVTGY